MKIEFFVVISVSMFDVFCQNFGLITFRSGRARVVTHSASKLLAYNVHVDRQNLRARATEMQNVW